MRNLLLILFAVLSLVSCEDPGDELTKKEDSTLVDSSKKGSDFMQTTD